MGQDPHIFQIYGALDVLIEQGAVDPAVAERWVPAYGQGLEVGWYTRFRDAMGLEPIDSAEAHLEQALEGIASSDLAIAAQRREQEQDGIVNAHAAVTRLYALSYLLQARPDLAVAAAPGIDGHPITRVIEPLLPGSAEPGPDLERIRPLLSRLASPDFLADDGPAPDQFERLVSQLVADGAVDEAFALVGDIQCEESGRLQDVGADTVETVLLETEFCVEADSVQDFEGLLDPSKWAECFGQFWCGMEELPVSLAEQELEITRYLETVGDCEGEGLTLATCLQFRRVDVSETHLRLFYDLCSNPAAEADGKVVVDNGRIEVYQDGPGVVCISSTKNLAIEGINSAILQLYACVTIWGQGAKEMAFACRHADGGALPVVVETVAAAAEAPEVPMQVAVTLIGEEAQIQSQQTHQS